MTKLPPITKQTLLQIRCELFKRGDYNFICTSGGKTHYKQQEALTLLADNITTELAYGGAAGGAKSWTGAAWMTFMCECFHGVRGFVGRETLKDLRESTYITFTKVFQKYGIEGWKYNGQDHFITFANGSRIDFIDLVAQPRDPMYERFGSKEFTFGWIEEAGETTFAAYDTIKTRIGRHLNDKYGILGKILVTLNPKKNWVHTYFWKPYKNNELPKGVKFIPSLVTDNPFNESGYLEKLQGIKDKIKKQRLLYGNFDYDDDEDMLMDYDSIEDLFICEGRLKKGIKYITGDVARFGKDKSKIYLWDELLVIQKWTFEKNTIPELAKRVKEIADKNGIPMSRVLLDEDGVGGGCVDILHCRGFVNNSSPLDNPQSKESENYENLKTQCSYMAAEDVNNKITGFSESVASDKDFKEKFTEEAEQVKRRDSDSDKKLRIVPKEVVKELIGRSPDDWDCFMMRQWFKLTPKTKWIIEDLD